MNAADNSTRGTPAHGVRPRWLYLVLALAFLFVLTPFLFWKATWFGRPVSDQQLGQYLADPQHPRKAQHALSQIADRILSPNPNVRAAARRWYPQVIAVSVSPVDELRLTAAWVMGQDNSVPEFRQALLRLLNDSHPMVQRNAALALVRFGDTAGRPIILAMLEPYAVRAPQAGTLAPRLKIGDVVNPGTLLARIQDGKENVEVRSQVPGTLERWAVQGGAAVPAGGVIVLLAPSSEEVWEALRALYLIGQPEDLPTIEAYSRGVPNMPDTIRQQAVLTAEAIRGRSTR